MVFDWDEAKNCTNIQKHGIDFNDVPRMFTVNLLVLPDERFEYGEERFIGIGLLEVKVTLVVFVEKAVDKIRIISARKATKNESRAYERRIKN